MRAVVYNEPRDVSVAEVPDPKIEKPTDVLVKISSTNAGSGLKGKAWAAANARLKNITACSATL